MGSREDEGERRSGKGVSTNACLVDEPCRAPWHGAGVGTCPTAPAAHAPHWHTLTPALSGHVHQQFRGRTEVGVLAGCRAREGGRKSYAAVISGH